MTQTSHMIVLCLLLVWSLLFEGSGLAGSNYKAEVVHKPDIV